MCYFHVRKHTLKIADVNVIIKETSFLHSFITFIFHSHKGYTNYLPSFLQKKKPQRNESGRTRERWKTDPVARNLVNNEYFKTIIGNE